MAGSGASGTEQGINFFTANALRATMLGNGNFGINTTAPSSRFHIQGSGFRFVDGNQGNGKVLTSDANGNASWQNASGGGSNAWNLTGNSNANPFNHFVGTTNFAPLIFRTNNVSRMELEDGNPNLLFNNTNPDNTALIGLRNGG